jgi:hypothetical protein
MAFPVEDIPGEATLYLRVHAKHFIDFGDPPMKRPSSACFRHPNMSVNWSKYSTAVETAKDSSAAVVALIAQDCISLRQTVVHAPIQEGEPDGPNQAHSEVRGEKSRATSYEFVRLSKVVWVRNPPRA